MDVENLFGVVTGKIPVIKQRMINHDEKLQYCSRWNKILSTIHIILTTLIGSLTTIQLTNQSSYISYLILVVGWLIATVTGIINYTKFPNQVDAHRQAVLLYSGVLEQIEELKLVDKVQAPSSLINILKEYRLIKRVGHYVKQIVVKSTP
jgi:uncharacterized membrane protein YdbT with pleckstrin-like domain